MSHSCAAAASEISGVAGLGALLGLLVADAVVEPELPVGAGFDSLPHAVRAAAAQTPAKTRVLREIQRL
ncbi:hypothetical protein [Nocardia sp. NPDC049149]|uniref:hypothetical protein n=1 Tax=Nocardia sp. NPDC049149 TaxID=3364315 RepID=UPI0037161D5D